MFVFLRKHFFAATTIFLVKLAYERNY